LRLNIRLKAYVNGYTPLDREMVLLQCYKTWPGKSPAIYNLAAGRFRTKKLYSNVYVIELEFYSQKQQIRFLNHPLGY